MQTRNSGSGACVRRHRLLATTALMSLALLSVAPRSAEAANIIWQGDSGPTGSNWNLGTNWVGGAAPISDDDVTIKTSPPSTVINGFAADANSVLIDSGGALSVINPNGSLSTDITVGFITVGETGQGTLTIQNKGVVTGGTVVFLGYEKDGVGIATVNGADSLLTATNGLIVGAAGHGTLTVTGGGAVTSLVGIIGRDFQSTGTATIDGSKWNSMDALGVGSSGQGTLLIQNGGTVTADDVNLGYSSTGEGTVTVNGTGSSLGTEGNPVSYLTVGFEGKGTVNVINGGAVYIANDISVGYLDGGQGTLVIQNGGAVAAKGTVDLGYAMGSAGTVTVDGSGSSLSAADGLTVGNAGKGTLTIQNGGEVKVGAGAGTVVIALDPNSFGTLNIGGGAAPGTVNAATVEFGAGTGTINFNHTATNYEFKPGIAGFGTINHVAGVTILTGNSTGFTGTTNVTGGSLYVNGTLGGIMTKVATAGTLGGTGTLLGPLTVDAGGNVAPGPPGAIGTLNVAAATFNDSSTFTVQLDQAKNGHLNSTDTVTINGGTVHVTPFNGTDTGSTYAVGTKYTIITAANGVTGTFAGVTDDFAFLDFTLNYDDPNNVVMTSQVGVTTFCLPGMSANQCATGNGAFSLGGGTVYNAVLNLSAAEAPLALNKLSGEIHASAQSALIEDSRFVREAALNRVRSAFDAVGASSMQAFAYAPGGLQAAPANTDRFAVWGQAFGSFGNVNSDGNASRFGRDIGGLFFGGDGQVGNHWRIGALAGYSHSRFDVNALSSSGTSDNYHLGVYGGGEWGALGLRYGGAYSWHDLNTARGVAFTGFADHLAAGYRAGTGQVFGEVGYELRAGAVRYEPFANLAYVNLHSNGFTETGGAAALVVASQSADTAFSTIGLRAQTTLAPSFGQTTLRGTLGWRHAYGDVVPTSLMTFAAGGNPFTIAGVPIAKDALVFDTGLDVKLTPSATLGLSYNGQYGSGATDQGMKANLTVKF